MDDCTIIEELGKSGPVFGSLVSCWLDTELSTYVQYTQQRRK